MIYPSEKEFLSLSRRGNLIPVYKEIVADLETPVSAYLQIARGAKYSFLLESVEGEEKIARFSFLAKNPDLILTTKNKTATITRPNGKSSFQSRPITDNPLNFIRDILKEYKFVNLPQLPRFCGGMVGFASYDIVRFFERLPNKTKDDTQLPDMIFVLAKDLLIFDHRNHKIKILSCAHVDPKGSRAQKVKAYREALKKIEALHKDLHSALPANKTASS